jgi:hypothetical protein
MRYALLVVAAVLVGVGPAAAQQSTQLENFMNSRVGTTAISAFPQFADGKLTSCLLEFNVLARDAVYRQGGLMKVFGSFGVMEAKNVLAVALKLVVHDIDMKTAEFRPSPPANSYFVFGAETSKASLVG